MQFRSILAMSAITLVAGLVSCSVFKKDDDDNDQTIALAALALASSPGATFSGRCQLSGGGAKCEEYYNNSLTTSALTTHCTTNFGGTFSATTRCSTTSLLGTCKLNTNSYTGMGGPSGGGTTISYRYSGTEPGTCTSDGGTFSSGVQSP
ncbi:MAG: hypothetical protein K8S54_15110 [Spirochaetia bacterium]|nr:hypothetical protein [Spirochaetia bacterium]